jgi:protein-tyrosine kinase
MTDSVDPTMRRGESESRELVPLGAPCATGTAVVRYEKNRIGSLLVSEGKMSSKGVTRVLHVQKRNGTQKFGELAIRLNLVSDRDVQIALCRQFGYPSVEELEGRLSPELYMALAPFSRAAELLNKVLAQLPRSRNGSGGLAIAIVSPDPKEGRSTFAANLALAYAQSGRKTLLIDGDLRRPRQHQLFGLSHARGLTSLSGDWYAGDEELDLANPTQLFGLSIVQSGSTYANPIEVLNSERFAKLVGNACSTFDTVLIDTPPAREYADAEAIAGVAARALIVTREKCSHLERVQSIVASAKRLGVEVLGSVLATEGTANGGYSGLLERRLRRSR